MFVSPGHTRYRVEPVGAPRSIVQHVAVCECGWRSPLLSSGGLAGSAWYTHAEATLLDLSIDDQRLILEEYLAGREALAAGGSVTAVREAADARRILALLGTGVSS